MKLYHWTKRENVRSILKEGLKPSGLGIVYLTPSPQKWDRSKQSDVCLEVETGELKLTAFEDCSIWEVLCWGKIQPENIRAMM